MSRRTSRCCSFYIVCLFATTFAINSKADFHCFIHLLFLCVVSVDFLNDFWVYNPGSNTWTWLGGSATSPDNSNTVFPSARHGHNCWTDSSDKMWLFGGAGNGYHNDLWYYTSDHGWVLVHAQQETSQYVAIGELGYPMGRVFATMCLDNPHNTVWLYGGIQNDALTAEADYWSYNMDLHIWRWEGGPVPNTSAVPAASFPSAIGVAGGNPGATGAGLCWFGSKSRSHWLMGGLSMKRNLYTTNTLWRYDIPTCISLGGAITGACIIDATENVTLPFGSVSFYAARVTVIGEGQVLITSTNSITIVDSIFFANENSLNFQSSKVFTISNGTFEATQLSLTSSSQILANDAVLLVGSVSMAGSYVLLSGSFQGKNFGVSSGGDVDITGTISSSNNISINASGNVILHLNTPFTGDIVRIFGAKLQFYNTIQANTLMTSSTTFQLLGANVTVGQTNIQAEQVSIDQNSNIIAINSQNSDCGRPSHGGNFGGEEVCAYNCTGPAPSPFDSVVAPINPGPGAICGQAIGNGGGAVQISASSLLTVNGVIAASGTEGGGAGGSIKIDAAAWVGSGSVLADGGDADGGFGGGGGRISVTYLTSSFAGPIHAFGGDGSLLGGPGTIVYVNKMTNSSRMVITNNGEISGEIPFPSLPSVLDISAAWFTSNDSNAFDLHLDPNIFLVVTTSLNISTLDGAPNSAIILLPHSTLTLSLKSTTPPVSIYVYPNATLNLPANVTHVSNDVALVIGGHVCATREVVVDHGGKMVLGSDGNSCGNRAGNFSFKTGVQVFGTLFGLNGINPVEPEVLDAICIMSGANVTNILSPNVWRDGTSNGTCPVLPPGICGNGICESSFGENCVTCPIDNCPSPCGLCNDGFCDPATETCESCYFDCKQTCPPKTCTPPDCSGHGQCVYGSCQCFGNYTGPACADINQPLSITPNSSNPSLNFGGDSPITFMLYIRSLTERDTQNSVVAQIKMETEFFYFNKDPNSSSWIYNTTLSNKAIFAITIQYFSTATTIPFANQTLSFPADTLKLNAKLQNWPFMALSHTLSLDFQITTPKSPLQSCNLASSVSDNNGLQWVLVSVDGTTMYGQFLDEAVLDGVPRGITFQLDQSNNLISAVMPHFWQDVEMDPTFSVLLGGQHKDTCKKGGLGTTKIALIIVFSVLGGLALIVLVLFVLYPRLKLKMQVRKGGMVEMKSSSDDINVEKRGDMETHTVAGNHTVKFL